MPGLAGFIPAPDLTPDTSRDLLLKMQDTLTGPPSMERTPFCSPDVCATLVDANVQRPGQAHVVKENLQVWLDGEFYNRAELAQTLQHPATSDGDLLIALLNTRPAALAQIDGIFTAVVHDSQTRETHLISDRYALRPCFWSRMNGSLAWASEMKALCHLPGFRPKINRQALNAFLKVGYFFGHDSWFEGIERLPPATILTYSLADRSITQKRYWWWDQIPSFSGSQDLAEELGRRFIRAVERRCPPEDSVGLVLSGGLDSRAILAAIPNRANPVPVFTFGRPESPDVHIARQAAARKPAEHTTLEISPENWLAPRIEGIWWSDGLLDLLHMHGIEHLDTMAARFQSVLNGAGGDGLAGAGYLFDPKHLDTFLTTRFYLSDQDEDIHQALREEYARAGSPHAFYVNHRIRNFTLHGAHLGLFKGMTYRLPFLDNGVQEWLFSIPFSVKKNNRLYRRMLLSTFPEYFRKLPWQYTGVPLSWPNWAVTGYRIGRKLSGKKKPGFTSYPDWLRTPPASPLIQSLLLSPKACFPDFLPRKQVTQTWENHLSGQDHSALLGRYLTFEIFLQQHFEKRWRSAEQDP